MISITVDGGSAAEIHIELRKLLEGDGRMSIASNGVNAAGAEAGEIKGKPASGRTRQTAAEKAAAAQPQGISTGEERVDPEADKQDAIDEAAESAKTKPVDLTHDDVKKVLGAHVQAYGMAASQADVKLLLNTAEKLSDIPNTQPALAAAILSIAAAIEKNPRNHDLAGDGLSKEVVASITPIVQAARAVK